MKFHHNAFLTALSECHVPADHALEIMGNVLTQEETDAINRAKLREENKRKAALNAVARRLQVNPPHPEVVANEEYATYRKGMDVAARTNRYHPDPRD